jgi:excisionase family DNA binding protein
MRTTTAQPDVLTVAEVANYLRLSTSAVYRALEEGRLPGTKPLGRWRVLRAELDEWLSAQGPVPRRRPDRDPMPRVRRRGSVRAQVVELGPRRSR